MTRLMPAACDLWLGAQNRSCGRTESVRRYLPGWRCPDHTPCALAGRPEPGAAGYDIPTPRWSTSPTQPGGSDITKARRGGYTSRQAAEKRAAIWRATHPEQT